MSNEIVSLGSIPAHLQKYLKADKGAYQDQLGHLDPQDFGLNFIKIVHGQSAQATAG